MSEYPCPEHSGIAADIKHSTQTVVELKESIKNLHRRFDEQSAAFGHMELGVEKKLNQYGSQIQEHFAESMKLFTDPKSGVIMGEDGLQKKVERHDTQIKLAWKVMVFVFAPPTLYIIGLIFMRIFKIFTAGVPIGGV